MADDPPPRHTVTSHGIAKRHRRFYVVKCHGTSPNAQQRLAREADYPNLPWDQEKRIVHYSWKHKYASYLVITNISHRVNTGNSSRILSRAADFQSSASQAVPLAFFLEQ